MWRVRLAETRPGRRAYTLTNVAASHLRRAHEVRRAHEASGAAYDDEAGVLLLDRPKWRGAAFALRRTKAPALIEHIVFDIDIGKGLSETVPTTGLRRKSRDHLQPRSGRIPQPCGIGSSSTRLRLRFSRRTRVHHHKLGWTRFQTTLPLQERQYQMSVSQGFSSRRSLLVFHCLLKSTPQRKNKSRFF